MNDLEEIKQRIDIVSFINEFVVLKKAGRNFNGLCPFHSEKSPSFIVSPERQIWHCFGACGEGGDIFTFLMKVENLEFSEALEILAKKAGIKLTNQYRTSESQKLKDDIFKANQYAGNYFHYLLTSHKVGEKAREYLAGRKISKKIIDTFSLGYAPKDWDGLLGFLRKKDIKDYLLVKAGLVISGAGGRIYDRFRGRLMFTLRDHRGNITGFAGRIIPGQEGEDRDLPAGRQEAKYINTSETPVYIKGNILYGLDITKEAIRKAGEAIIVEGEFDLLSSFQTGVTNIVAIKGTALTLGQVNLLKRFTGTISLALDSDIAGDAAARRGIEIAENVGFNIKVIQIPLGKDPDDCVKKDPALWKKAVLQSIPVYDYLLESVLKRYDKTKAYDKRKITDEILPFYAKIANTIVQSHYVTLLAKNIDIAEERLWEVLEKIKKGKTATFTPSISPKEEKTRHLLLGELFLSLLLQAPKIDQLKNLISQEEITKIVLAIENPAIKKITSLFYDWIIKLKDDVPLQAQFIKTLSSELVPLADKAYLIELGELITDKEKFKKELLATKHDLLALAIRRRMKELPTKIKDGSDEEALKSLNKEFRELSDNLKMLG